MATMNTLYVLDELCIYLIKSPRASRCIRPNFPFINTFSARKSGKRLFSWVGKVKYTQFKWL